MTKMFARMHKVAIRLIPSIAAAPSLDSKPHWAIDEDLWIQLPIKQLLMVSGGRTHYSPSRQRRRHGDEMETRLLNQRE